MDFQLHVEFPDAIADEWDQLLAESPSHFPFLQHDYLKIWWQTRGGGEWPQASLAVITAYEGKRLIGIAPFFRAVHDGKDALLFLGSIEISDFLDLIVRQADLPAFTAGLLAFLRSPAAGALQHLPLDLYNLLETSPTIPALQAAGKAIGAAVQVEKLQHSPVIALPGDWNAYLESLDKKQRHEIRRKLRRIETFGLPIRWEMATDKAQLEAQTEVFFSLMRQDREKQGFLTPAMEDQMRRMVRFAFDSGSLQLAFLYIGDQPAASYLNFDFQNQIWVYNSGIDLRFMDYSPGWVLLANLLQWANENKRASFDFMRGNEEYKYRFGAVDRFVMRVLLF